MLSWTSFVTLLDKVADKGVTDLATAKNFVTSALTAVEAMPPGLVQTQVESGLNAVLPFITLLNADLSPIATALDAQVKALVPMSAAQAVQVVAAVATAVSAAAPGVSAAAQSAASAVAVATDGH